MFKHTVYVTVCSLVPLRAAAAQSCGKLKSVLKLSLIGSLGNLLPCGVKTGK